MGRKTISLADAAQAGANELDQPPDFRERGLLLLDAPQRVGDGESLAK
jgi:hypothetical protein